MRIARKLTLLAMLALAATALTAPSAFAQETEPELHNQTPRLIAQQEVHVANDVNCPAVVPTPPVAVSPLVTSGGCRLHIASVGTVALVQHAPEGTEFTVTVCTVEFDARIDAAAEGWLVHHEFTGPAGVCNVRPCGQTAPGGEGRGWSFHMRETEPAPREVAQLLFCIEPIGGGNPSHCELTVPFTQPSTTHRYHFTAQDARGHGAFIPRCEITGTFETEAGGPLSGENQAYQNVEIRHT